MANIEQFIKTLKREKADYVPVAELGVHPTIKSQILGRPINSLFDDVEFWFTAGYDYIKLQPSANFNPAKINSSKETSDKLDSAANFNWASEGTGIIGSFDDYDNYKFPAKCDFNYSKFDEVKRFLPDGMGVVGQYGDIFTMTWEMMGFEGFSYALFEKPELITQLNNTLGELVYGMFESMAQHDSVDIMFYSDDIAFTNGLLMSPDVLDQFFFPWLKKIGDLAKKYNKPLIYHSDGILYDVMDKLIECGVDALHPIEPKAMALRDVRERYGDKLSLIGHVEVDVLARGTIEDVKQIVRSNIELFANEGGYCVGSSNSIPAYVKVENYLAMNKAAKEYGAKI